MKKVWVLEKRATIDELKKELFNMIDLLDNTSAEERSKLNVAGTLCELEEKIEDNPHGVFHALFGRESYRQFCNDAKDYIENHQPSTRADYHVIVGEVPDEAQTWIGFNPVERKEGVERYLFATLSNRE